MHTGGSAVTGYELRYFAGGADPSGESGWVEEGESTGVPDPGMGTSATITGLAADTAYRVQVRARSAGGAGAWSASGSATTGSAPASNNAPRLLKLGSSKQLRGEDRGHPVHKDQTWRGLHRRSCSVVGP